MINFLVIGFAFAFGGDGTYIVSTNEKESIGAVALYKGKLTLIVIQNDEIVISLGF